MELAHVGVAALVLEEVQGWVGQEGEECICPQCGIAVPHEAGIPCFYKICPKCGAKMVRK
jgi:hypothetical protein